MSDVYFKTIGGLAVCGPHDQVVDMLRHHMVQCVNEGQSCNLEEFSGEIATEVLTLEEVMKARLPVRTAPRAVTQSTALRLVTGIQVSKDMRNYMDELVDEQGLPVEVPIEQQLDEMRERFHETEYARVKFISKLIFERDEALEALDVARANRDRREARF